jgi:hypothetical protein
VRQSRAKKVTKKIDAAQHDGVGATSRRNMLLTQ